MSDEVENAIRALAHRLYERDQQDPDERAAPSDFALEFITAMRGRGWICNPPPPPPPRRAPGQGTAARGAALARQSLAARRSVNEREAP